MILRVVKDKENPYVMMNKTALKDKSLSWKGKGLLAYLLSLPDNWKIYETELIKHAKDGRDATRSAIKELEKAGYIKRKRHRDESGRLTTMEYSVYEVPTYDGFSDVGKSNIGKSNTINNELTNNDETKELKNIYVSFPADEHKFLNIYNDYFKFNFGKEHMRVTPEQETYIMDCIGTLESFDVDAQSWLEAVKEHFFSLPKKNNGNILAFLKASHRYFDVDLKDVI